MQQIITQIRERAKQLKKAIVLPETEDPRVLEAAFKLWQQGICRVVLLGNESNIREQANNHDIRLPKEIKIQSTNKPAIADSLIEHLHQKRKHKGISKEEAAVLLSDNPLYLASCMVATGKVHAGVGGSVATTGDVIRAAIHGIGLRKETQTVSSTFLMALEDGRVLTYADCGVVPYPNAEQLADIAVESARTHRRLTEQEPKAAMLSFSTKGSAKHERTALVTDALTLAQEKDPDLIIDGELQFDAAFVPEVALRKAPDSTVAGAANVFIFPNLDAGNIGYKITERVAGASATGPILQGLAKPMMDLSRGCNCQDIINAACVAIIMAD